MIIIYFFYLEIYNVLSKKPEDEIKKGLPSNKGRGEDNITIGTVHGNKNEKKKNCC